mmetsp:Transcript_25493/g.25739  ORF Transcript_25493/g.25739 Transcript_25493/m.25739 type:complete len:481 (-) Transcript_25493:99-1541(-)
MASKEVRLLMAMAFSLTFMVVEIIGGVMADSLAVLSDAAHLLTDIFGFSLALAAAIYAKYGATKDFTFGLGRAEALGALGSILTLWVMTGWLVYHAFKRSIKWFQGNGEEVDGKIMFFVACLGVLVNICLATIFHDEHGGAFHSHDHSHSHGHSHEHNHSHGHDHAHGNSKSGGDVEMSGSLSHVEEGSEILSPEEEYEEVIRSVDKEITSPLRQTNGQRGYKRVCTDDDHTHDNVRHTRSHEHSHEHSHGHSHEHSHTHSDDHSPHPTDVTALTNTGDHMSYGAVVDESIDDKHHGDDTKEHASSYVGDQVSKVDVNIEAAYLHVLTDLIQSVGVAMAGLIIWFFPSWQIVDPMCTFLFSMMVLYSTVSLFQRVIAILFEGCPPDFDWHALQEALCALPNVVDVHDLHVWSITTGSIAMTCHIKALKPQEALVQALSIARKFHIHHSTIQVQQVTEGDIEGCHSHWCQEDNTKFQCMRH